MCLRFRSRQSFRPAPSRWQLQYGGEFDRNLAGLFKVEEQGEAYALAKSESIQARSYLPGFDEPGLKATFDISLTIPEGQEAIGNGPVAEQSKLPATDWSGLSSRQRRRCRPTSCRWRSGRSRSWKGSRFRQTSFGRVPFHYVASHAWGAAAT